MPSSSSRTLQPDWASARRALTRADSTLGNLIRQVGPCRLERRRDHFIALCQSIFSQQISTVVAARLFERFRNQFPRKRPTPAGVLRVLNDGERWRECGLSRQKRDYLLDLARHFDTGQLAGHRLAAMENEPLIETLCQVKGIGRWTAEMFLIFVLSRPDVLPVDDLGLRKGVQKAYGLTELPDRGKVAEYGEAWRPWRTVATWYLWRGLEL